MAGSINKVMLIGNLGRDPEVKTMQSGGKVCNLSIATSESWKDKSTGERKEKTEWHRVVVFNEGIIKVCESYLKKGAKVFVEGQLETRKWTDQSGAEKYSTEVVLRPFRGELSMLDTRNVDQSSGHAHASGGSAMSGQGAGGWGASAGGNDFEDDIPF